MSGLTPILLKTTSDNNFINESILTISARGPKFTPNALLL